MNQTPRIRTFGSLFDDNLIDLTAVNRGNLLRSDLYEDGNNYVMEVDLPGFKKEDIAIDYDRGYLLLTAKKEEVKEETKEYLRRERFYGTYERSFYVGNINENSIVANYHNGILKIVFPKENAEYNTKKAIKID